MKTKFLAIDYGLKRTGLSITDTDKIFAFPLVTIDTSELIIHLKNLIEKAKSDRENAENAREQRDAAVKAANEATVEMNKLKIRILKNMDSTKKAECCKEG